MSRYTQNALDVLLSVLLVVVGFASGYVLRGRMEPAAAAGAAPVQAQALPAQGQPGAQDNGQAPAPTLPSLAALPTTDATRLPQAAVLWADDKTNAPVTVHVFIDFECPFCHQWLKETYPEIAKRADTHLVFHALPLSSIHPHAELAAEIGFCAADGGWFPDYLQAITAMDNLGDDLPAVIAARLPQKTTADALTACAQSKEQAVKDAESLGQALHLDGTPAFVIDGHILLGAYPPDAFSQLIEEAKP